MLMVLGCWVLAMASGLLWARWWTGVFTMATLLLFVWSQASSLAHLTGWLQLAVLGATPWLLAAQRAEDEQKLQHQHAEEAKQMTRLSESARTLLTLQASTQRMESQITEITDVYHVIKETARALHFQELFSSSLAIAPRLLDARGFRLIDLSRDVPTVLRATRTTDGRISSANGDGAGEVTNHHALEMEEAIIKQVVASGRSASGSSGELSCALPEGLSRVAWAPLWREQKPIGVLVADELPDEQMKMLSLVANQLSLQLSRIHLYQEVESLAVTDALTGLFVRRHFLERAREELARSKRHGLPFTILMGDLDLFKQKNDTYGHLVGDVVLKDVARLLHRNLRDIDLIARYGGEEFILLLVETHIEQALPIAERLRQLVEIHPIRAYDELLAQTISIGLAEFPHDGQTFEELIERADQALYVAKRAGRNQVVRWTPSIERSTPV